MPATRAASSPAAQPASGEPTEAERYERRRPVLGREPVGRGEEELLDGRPNLPPAHVACIRELRRVEAVVDELGVHGLEQRLGAHVDGEAVACGGKRSASVKGGRWLLAGGGWPVAGGRWLVLPAPPCPRVLPARCSTALPHVSRPVARHSRPVFTPRILSSRPGKHRQPAQRPRPRMHRWMGPHARLHSTRLLSAALCTFRSAVVRTPRTTWHPSTPAGRRRCVLTPRAPRPGPHLIVSRRVSVTLVT